MLHICLLCQSCVSHWLNTDLYEQALPFQNTHDTIRKKPQPFHPSSRVEEAICTKKHLLLPTKPVNGEVSQFIQNSMSEPVQVQRGCKGYFVYPEQSTNKAVRDENSVTIPWYNPFNSARMCNPSGNKWCLMTPFLYFYVWFKQQTEKNPHIAHSQTTP